MSLTFLCFKWRPFTGYRSKFSGRQVDTLRRMVKRFYPHPHRFVCVTDDWSDITEPDVEVFKLWDDLSHIPNPSSPRNPSCYRRLKVFAENAGDWLGERFVCMDLDCVILNDLTPLFDTDADFKIWRSTTQHNEYNGSMWMVRAGAHPELWEEFDPIKTPRLTIGAKKYGSDQGWFAYRLPGMPTWGPEDGVYSFRSDLRQGALQPPRNARIVFFHGKHDPWDADMQRLHHWIRENYQ